jgi:hypothetical protein
MQLETTTSDPTSQADPNPQLDEVETKTEAVTGDEVTSQSSESTDSGSEEETSVESRDNSEDDELKEWAAKKNLPLDDPIKLAKMYRESEALLGKKGSQEGQLKNAVSDANTSSGVDDVQALRNEVSALSFYIAHPEAKQFETEMVGILEEKPWLAGDLEVVLDAAKGRSSTEAAKLLDAKKTGGKEALAQAEKATRAAAPRASASSTDYSNNKITSENVDALIARNGQKWYIEHRDEINSVLANDY